MSSDVRNRKKKKAPDEDGATDGDKEDATTSTVASQEAQTPQNQAQAASQEAQTPQNQAQARQQQGQTTQTLIPPGFKEEKIIIFEIPQKWFYFLMFLIGLLCVLLCSLVIIGRNDPTQIPEDIAFNIGEEGVLLFQQYDRDSDGYLSIQEFEPLVYRLLETNVSGPVYDVPITPDDELITLKSYFIPIVKESMSKDLNDSLPGTMNSLHGLEKWQNVTLHYMNFGASHFSGFLPKDVDNIMLGSPYFIINVEKGFFNGALSSNRYYPPKVTTNESIIIHRLLTLFHPRPFVVSRFPAQGSVACVRAYNDKYLDIVFRIHAEFQLNEPPYHPFWFTPAQFTGNIIISKDGKHIQYFNLYVPNNKRLNIDMEWLNGPNESENMEVDIGFMPLMQLNSTQSSVPVINLEDYELLNPLPERPQHKTEAERTEWMATIDLEDAKSSLEKTLYPFKKVPYYNFTEAFKKAEDDKKLVHTILLWGALDDQSC